MRKLLDPAHMLSHDHLDWRHRKQTRVKLSILFTWIALDVVEIHAGQPTVRGLDVYLEVLVAYCPQIFAAVVSDEVSA